MAIATANDIIQQAFQNLLGINVSATMPTADISNALDVLNAMMDNLSADGLLTIGQVRESFPLVYNQQAYTIGSSGNFNTAKPINISSCFVRDSNNNAYRMQVGTREIWDGLSDKDLSALVGIPELLFYDPGLTQQATQVGTIYIYPTPDASTTYTLFLESEKMLTEFSSLSTSINMPLYYKEMLVYQLMLRLPLYGREVHADMRDIADKALHRVMAANARNKTQRVAFNLPGQRLGLPFNPFTGM